MIDLGINLFQEIAALGGGGEAYPITNSLRFNDDDLANLSRTPSVAGDRKKWTWSGWVKRGKLDLNQFIFTANIAAGDESFEFTNGNTLRLRDGNSATTLLETNAVFRDPSGWYHIVLVYDSANSTGAIYVNGIQQSLSTNNISLNRDSAINNSVLHRISGYVIISASYFDGYLAETHFIDGQALTANDFGRTISGEWSPIEYEGTYGTNGFYLPFDGNANDDSGNGNNWTENNLASTDFMIDTPSNNFSVWNALDATNVALSQGNLLPIPSVDWYGVASTFVINSGKYYAEFCSQTSGSGLIYQGVGIVGLGLSNYFPFSGSPTASYSYTGVITVNGSVVQTVASSGSGGEIIGIALDLDGNTITFYKNGVLLGTPQSLPANTTGGWIFKYNAGANRYSVANFGADSSFAGIKTRQNNTDENGKGDFYYAPPTGFLAICTENTGGDPIADIT